MPGSPSRPQVPPNCDLTLGMTCVDKSVPGRTVWAMTADERFANPVGIVQGGFLGAFADSAMGSAAVTWLAGRRMGVANAEMKVSFFAPVAVGQALRCLAEVVSGGRRTAFVEATVTLEDGTVVARASSTYLFKERPPRL